MTDLWAKNGITTTSIGGNDMQIVMSMACDNSISLGYAEYFAKITAARYKCPNRTKRNKATKFSKKKMLNRIRAGKHNKNVNKKAILIFSIRNFVGVKLFDHTKYSFSGFK